MDIRPRKVEHIVIFDSFDPMVAGPTGEAFWYKHQTEYFIGNKKIKETNYNSKKLGVSSEQLGDLKKRVNKLLESAPFCYTDVEDQPEWVDFNVRGGSTISYMGENREKFLQKVMNMNEKRGS